MILARSYLWEILQRLVMVLTGVVFLIGLGAAIRASSTSQGAPLWVPLSLVPLIIGQALPYFFPVVLLIGVVLTYGRMASNLEHISAFAAGYRPMRLLTAAMLAGLMVFTVSYPITAEVVPSLYQQMRGLLNRVPVAALENTNPGSSELQYAGLYLSWQGRSGPGVFHNVLLSLEGPNEGEGNGGEELRLRANTARMTVDGNNLGFNFDGLRTFRDSRGLFSNPEKTWLVFNLEEIQKSRDDEVRAKDLPSSRILEVLADGSLAPERHSHFRFIYWQRWSMCFATLPLAFIGALLGWRLRKGGFLAGFAASLMLLLFVFYPVFYLCDNLEESGSLNIYVAAWLPSLIMVPIAALLYSRVSRV
ncbi:MAG: LptF/LptG family permease [Planctomycetota bacterium]|nr:LptF/LptG family permease [Planctomycetota bacterium]MDA1113510.1 LptF/LptG family permease [Planctomycetota bacterium]